MINRHEVGGVGQFDHKSDAELRAFIRDGRARLGLLEIQPH
jgi:hypothetical protein